MTTLDKAKRILRGAKGHHSTVNRDQWRKGYDTGKADARFGYFGQTARRSNFGYSYCRGYLLGWRSISHGAKSIHHFRRYPEELQHDI